ncbi:hypothetical protein HO133_009185 [Letharia lupina]|uniref:Purine-cytosine permease n=1 Tax=Letharia lupina TaxID=560253 RepID=A0A8H6CML1_9LECA|nr:uncharacterized protein HO133_009185 [Letharia lupina]KAF6226319.1 hypothetical protein HO133_009185 [Letharia lupina]
MDDKNDYHVGSYSPNGTDAEKGPPIYTSEAPAVPTEIFLTGDSVYAKIQRAVFQFGVEPRGIERVPEDERTDTNLMKVGTMWFSANMVVSSFAIGALAIPVFSLGFVDSLLTIFFINCLAITPVAFFSTFGPRFGLRQMVLSRYFFGFHGVKIIACFNVLACVGWSAVNVIVGAQLINAVNTNVPGYAGIIIIAAATWIVTVFGYKVVHVYEFWSWIPSLIIFLIVLGEFAHSGKFRNLPMNSGSTEAGSVLSFAASVFGFGTGWTSYAADYTVYQPVSVSRVKTFAWTWGGLILPLCFTEMLGLAVATATLDPVDTSYADGYNQSGIGGLLAAVLFPPLGRFGQFCLVILALSIIANNCPNIYSVTFSLQLLGRWTQAVPRFIWTFVGTLVYCAIAIPGYSHFAQVLEDFMLLIGYWLAIYEGISLTEHFIFKQRKYDITIWNSPGLLPPGIAAVFAFCFGIFGAVMGMSQAWFIGPIGKRIGDPKYGGDVGFELAFAFSAVSFAVFRSLEKKQFGR